MNFNVQFWEENESRLDYRWFDSLDEAMLYVEYLKKQDNIATIRVLQPLYELEK